MRWEPPTLAALAADAGFRRDELATAVAVAVAASGGHPHHDHQIGPPGSGRYVGLWGIDVDRWSHWAAADLYDSLTAAQAAHTLTRRCDGFGWSAHWRARSDVPHRTAAGIALTRAPYRDREHDPVVGVLWADNLPTLRRAAAERIARSYLWPRTMT